MSDLARLRDFVGRGVAAQRAVDDLIGDANRRQPSAFEQATSDALYACPHCGALRCLCDQEED